MRYLGGKYRLAKRITEAIATAAPGATRVWDPFCGGLGMVRQLSERWDVVASDANPDLIDLYTAWIDGWRPPPCLGDLSNAAHRAILARPRPDPLRAFVGFGCSFGGVWGGGVARLAPKGVVLTPEQVKRRGRPTHIACSNALAKDLKNAHRIQFAHMSFFDIAPKHMPGLAIYCDPPYEGTEGYGAVDAFDHAAFWGRCEAWAAHGVRVFVSEFTNARGCPVVWSHERKRALDQRREQPTRTELLLEVTAPAC